MRVKRWAEKLSTDTIDYDDLTEYLSRRIRTLEAERDAELDKMAEECKEE